MGLKGAQNENPMSEEVNNGSGKSPHAEFKDMADDMVAMKILDLIDKSPHVSQSVIRFHTGLATGLVHSYMKKIINKGWVKAKQVSARRWLYYLTPEGFVEKSRLTVNYLSRTMHDYRKAQSIVEANIRTCMENGWKRLIIAGENDLAEIAALNVKSTDGLQLAAVVADRRHGETIANMEILPYRSVVQIEFDRILLCDSGFLKWAQRNGEERIEGKVHFLMGEV